MNIIVLIKTARFIYAQTGADLKNNYIGPDDILHVLNPFDELALECALAVQDGQPNTRIEVISLGDEFARIGLKRAIAMGADEAVHIECNEKQIEDAWATASILAAVCRERPFDLILCGANTIDGNSGLVGSYVAQMLDLPHISGIIHIGISEDNGKQVRIERKIERGDRQILSCTLPALFSVQKGTTIPRYPKLNGFLRAEDYTIEKRDILLASAGEAERPYSGTMTEVINVVKPKPKRKEEPATKKKISAMDRLKAITKREPAAKKEEGKIIDGGSDKMLERLDQVFREAGIVGD
jgi:electron transfer flavoprotein beta subunit